MYVCWSTSSERSSSVETSPEKEIVDISEASQYFTVGYTSLTTLFEYEMLTSLGTFILLNSMSVICMRQSASDKGAPINV